MKKTLFFTSIIASSVITSSTNAGNIEHLFYKPIAKQVVSNTSYNFLEREYQQTNTSYKDEQAEIREIISYGVNHKLTIDIDIAYQEKETKWSNTINKYDGLTNPNITTKYRVANQNDDGEFIDLKLSYAPDIFDREAASTTIDGTVAQGGATYAIGIDYGRDINDFTYKANFDTTHYDDYEQATVGGTSVVGFDDRTDINFGIKAQYRLNDIISANLGVSRTIMGNSSEDGVISTGGSSSTLSADINFAIDPQRSSISISFSTSDTDDTIKNNVTTTTADEKTTSGIAYKFRF